MKLSCVLVLSILLPSSLFAWDKVILSTEQETVISLHQLARELALYDTVILSEKHQTQSIQNAQAIVLDATLSTHIVPESFTLGWEFLNRKNTETVKQTFQLFKEGAIDAMGLLRLNFESDHLDTYIPILNALKAHLGNLIPTNLSREQKAPVVKEGLQAIDPELIPEGFEMGGEAYFERFSEAMMGHGSPTLVKHYFEAHCLTDDVIAYSFEEAPSEELHFLVVGSFHADYRDGVVTRIQQRMPYRHIATVKFVDASDYSEAELLRLAHHEQYGWIADYIYYVNEPLIEPGIPPTPQ